MIKLIGNGRDMERISCKIIIKDKEILAERINKELIENYNIDCDVTGDCNFEVALLTMILFRLF